MQILHDDRLIEPEFSFQIGFVGRVDISGGGKQDVDNIARDDAQQEKDDDRDPEQGHEHQCEAPYDISKHLAAPVSVHSVKSGYRLCDRSTRKSSSRLARLTLACGARGYLSSHTSS
jgi:hypothetical protein